MSRLSLLIISLISLLINQNALAGDDRNSLAQGFFTLTPYLGKVYLRGQDDARVADSQGTTTGFSLRYFTSTLNTDNIRYAYGFSSFVSSFGKTDAQGTFLKGFSGDLLEVGLARGLRDPLLGYISLYAGDIAEELAVNGPAGTGSRTGKRIFAGGLGFGGILLYKNIGLSLDANRLFFNSDYAQGSLEFDARFVLAW